MARLIFTAELCEKARGEKLDALSPLVLQWAGAEGPDGEQLRDQIERAAALVPARYAGLLNHGPNLS